MAGGTGSLWTPEGELELISRAVDALEKRGVFKSGYPTVAIVAGSGLGDVIAGALREAETVVNSDIPGFPQTTVPGHEGCLLFGVWGGRRVVVQKGRLHAYEGHSPKAVTRAVRLFAAIGCRCLILTNAAGGLDRSFNVGDVMMVRDQVYLPGFAMQSPLVGPNMGAFGPRFPPMNGAYEPHLRALVRKVAEAKYGGAVGWLREGCYAGVAGPAFESYAEVDALRTLGASAVGMSTAPEVAVAAHSSLPVLCLSFITNKGLGMDACAADEAAAAAAVDARWGGSVVEESAFAKPTHEEVLAAGRNEDSRDRMRALIEGVVTRLDIAIPLGPDGLPGKPAPIIEHLKRIATPPPQQTEDATTVRLLSTAAFAIALTAAHFFLNPKK